MHTKCGHGLGPELPGQANYLMLARADAALGGGWGGGRTYFYYSTLLTTPPQQGEVGLPELKRGKRTRVLRTKPPAGTRGTVPPCPIEGPCAPSLSAPTTLTLRPGSSPLPRPSRRPRCDGRENM